MTSLVTDTPGSGRDIAVLTDFSQCSSLALQHAIAVASYYNAKIFLVHAIEPRTFGYFPSDSNALMQLRSNADQNMLREAAKLRQVRHDLVVADGDTAHVLQQLLKSEDVGLVVLGASGMGEPHNDVLGSTAEIIVCQARCPVLCVGPAVEDHDSFPELTHILFATDLACSYPAATSYAVSLAARHRAHLSLFHAVPGGKPPDSREAEWMKEPYRDRLSEAIRARPGLYYPPETFVEFSEDPAEAILQVARQLPADLIVLGKARPASAAAKGGAGTASRTLAQAPCPVVVVPEAVGADGNEGLAEIPQADPQDVAVRCVYTG